MSWISLDDLVAVISFALSKRNAYADPVNAVAPNPVTNHEFTKTLGRVLRRPTVFPMPAFAARLAFGEMADGLLLASTRVEPKRLMDAGFRFRFPELEGALVHADRIIRRPREDVEPRSQVTVATDLHRSLRVSRKGALITHL